MDTAADWQARSPVPIQRRCDPNLSDPESAVRMPLRQTTGFVQSLLRLVGLDWAVPDFSTLCRRQRKLNVAIPYRGGVGPLNLLIDSTGIKAEGEGEWRARKNGGPKRRVWRKIHIGIDEETLEVRAVEVPGSNIGYAPIVPDFLDQISAHEGIADFGNTGIGFVTADGAYDERKYHEAIAARGAAVCHPAPQERQALEANELGRGGTKRSPARIKVSQPCHLTTVARISPPEPGCAKDELHQAAQPILDGKRLRALGRLAAGSHHRAERLHRSWHTRHSARRVNSSGEKAPAVRPGFVQQRLAWCQR